MRLFLETHVAEQSRGMMMPRMGAEQLARDGHVRAETLRLAPELSLSGRELHAPERPDRDAEPVRVAGIGVDARGTVEAQNPGDLRGVPLAYARIVRRPRERRA